MQFKKCWKLTKTKSLLLFIYFFIYFYKWSVHFYDLYVRPDFGCQSINCTQIMDTSYVDYIWRGIFFKHASIFNNSSECILFIVITIIFLIIAHLVNATGQYLYYKYKKKN